MNPHIELILKTENITTGLIKFVHDWETYHNLKDEKDEEEIEQRIKLVVEALLSAITSLKKDHVIKQFVKEENHILQLIKVDVKKARDSKAFYDVIVEIQTLLSALLNIEKKEQKALKEEEEKNHRNTKAA